MPQFFFLETIRAEYDRLKLEADNIKPIEIDGTTIKFVLLPTMLDGKITTIISDVSNNSTQNWYAL